MTSGGSLNPLNANLGGRTGRMRRRCFTPTASSINGLGTSPTSSMRGHAQCNSADFDDPPPSQRRPLDFSRPPVVVRDTPSALPYECHQRRRLRRPTRFPPLLCCQLQAPPRPLHPPPRALLRRCLQGNLFLARWSALILVTTDRTTRIPASSTDRSSTAERWRIATQLEPRLIPDTRRRSSTSTWPST